MPIGIVSDDEFAQELERLSPSPTKSVTPPPQIIEQDRPGRKEGDTNVPESLRKIIGETSVLEGRRVALQLANDFGISPSSVSAYAKGATSTSTINTPKPDIIQHINKSRRRVIGKAQQVMKQALGAITQEKLDYADAKDLSTIAKDMSVVIKNLEPDKSNGGEATPQQQFVIFAPQFRDERSFDSITVQE